MSSEYGEYCKNVGDPFVAPAPRRPTVPQRNPATEWAVSDSTRVTITEPMANLIRFVRRHDGESDTLPQNFAWSQVCNYYNTYVGIYLKTLPVANRGSNIIPCDAILRGVWNDMRFFRNDQHLTRDTLLKNITLCPGSVASTASVVEYEVSPLNHAQRGVTENQHRELALQKWARFEDKSTEKKADQWSFWTETSDAPPEKKRKVNPGEECVVCLERPRTHAFLHSDIIGGCS